MKRVDLGKAWGLLVAALAALGTIKTLVEVSSGQSMSLAKIAFYLGTVGINAYFGVAAAFTAFVVIGGVAALLSPGNDPPEPVIAVILALAVVFGLTITTAALFSNWLVYEEVDGVGRASAALIGLAGIAGAIYMWRRKVGEAAAGADEDGRRT